MHAYVLAQKVDLYHLVSIFSLEHLALNIWALSQLDCAIRLVNIFCYCVGAGGGVYLEIERLKEAVSRLAALYSRQPQFQPQDFSENSK
jgi:hypothetical protein